MTTQSFRFWTCSAPNCTAASVIDVGARERCQCHFCAKHMSSPDHLCDKTPLSDAAWVAARTEEFMRLRHKINDQALLRISSRLNGGMPCEFDHFDPVGRSHIGGMHIHLRIVFSDGTVWLARLPRENYTSFSDDFTNQVMETECATLNFLETLDLPTPKLHAYGLRNDPQNEVGAAYMLIDELPGTSLLLRTPTKDQLSKVYTQWADILLRLYAHPFKAIGALVLQENGEAEVGAIVGDRTGTFSRMGPFSNSRTLYAALSENYLELISDGQLYSEYPVDAYIIFRYLKELAEKGRWNAFESSLEDGPFYLKHTDDKGDHILVDDDYNITGVIDWTFARVVPAFDAFGPSLLTADTEGLFTGSPGLSSNDGIMSGIFQSKGSELAKFMEGPDLVRRFTFAVGMGMGMTWEEVESLWRGILSTATGINSSADWSVWRCNRIYDWANDERLRKLLIQQNEQIKTCEEQAPDGTFPRFATCSMSTCMRAGVRGAGCAKCKQHLCAIHVSKQYHTCKSSYELSDAEWDKSIDDEFWELLSQVNTHELVRIATELNRGIKCIFELGKHVGDGSMMGCANYHAWLVFENGERWVVRIPRTGFSDVPLDLVEYLVSSEYATLKFLESTKVPAPRPFGYGLASDTTNRVGVSYILMEALPGEPFYADNASQAQKGHLLAQLADILVELSKHPLPRIGSLQIAKSGLADSVVVGPVASNRFVTLETYGPFDTASEYLKGISERYMDLIADGQLYPDYPVEAFLFYHFLCQNIESLDSEDMPGQFFLKHVDDKGDHLLVDEHFNITGIIDWQFARAVPASEAFGPSYTTADLESLYNSNTGVTNDDQDLAAVLRERCASALASIAERNELMRRFHNGLASGFTRDEAREMLKGMKACVTGKEVSDLDGWILEQAQGLEEDERWKYVQALLRDRESVMETLN